LFGACADHAKAAIPKLFVFVRKHQKSLEDAKAFLRSHLKLDEKAIFFEHGSNGLFNAGGCRGSCGGIAHIHFLPLSSKSLVNPQSLSKNIKTMVTSKSTKNPVRQKPYLYYEVDGHVEYYHVENLPSQYLLKILYGYLAPRDPYVKWQDKYQTEQSKKLFTETLVKYKGTSS